MRDKITIKELEGDYCEQLESCETWDELSSKIEELVRYTGLKHFSCPNAIFKDSDGEAYETRIEIRAVKEPCELRDVLTKEIAEQYLADHKTMFLDEYTSIEEVAAESLSKHQGDLYFESLTELSDAAAESFSKHKGSLGLIGLTELSDAAAESLSKHQGFLGFDALTELSDTAAESFSKHKGDLGLFAIKELSDTAAESLSKHQGDLDLRGITKLSDAAVESLSKHQGNINDMDPKKWVESLRH